MDKQELTYAIKMKGLELGFSKVGITNAEDFSDYIEETVDNPDYTPWLDFDTSFHVAQGAKPKSFFPNAKSIICATYGYGDIMYPEKISNYIGYSYLSRCYSPLKTSSCGIRVEAFKDFLTENGCGLYAGNIAVPARRACAREGQTESHKAV